MKPQIFLKDVCMYFCNTDTELLCTLQLLNLSLKYLYCITYKVIKYIIRLYKLIIGPTLRPLTGQ